MDDIVPDNFDVGYMEGNIVVILRSIQDILEVWNFLSQGKKVVLWCDGLRENSSHKCSRKSKNKEDDSGNAKKTKEEKDRKVDEVISGLKETHGSNFTNMQYRIWAEMITGGTYSSYDNPPTSSMFMRAGAPKTKSPGIPI